MSLTRIMLVDDQMLLREGLKTIINTQSDLQVVLEAGDGQMALDLLESEFVDVVLMDIRMPVLDGVEATKRMKARYPQLAIIILTTFDDDDYIIEALANGAEGYLLKDIDAPHLLQSIRDARSGQMLLPGRIAARLAAHLAGREQVPRPLARTGDLSQREEEIAALVMEGLSNRQIASQLFLSEGTVKNYISEIYAKLGTNNRAKAAVLLRGMLKPGG